MELIAERPRRVRALQLEQLVARGDLGKRGEVAPRAHRQPDLRDLDAEDPLVLIVEPEAVLAAEAIPAEVVVEGFVDEVPANEVVLAAEVVPAEVVVESFVEALPVEDAA